MRSTTDMALERVLRVATQDTVVVVQSRDLFDWIQGAASSALLLLLLLLVAFLLGMMVQARALLRSMAKAGAAAGKDPAIEQLRKTAENLEAITSRARDEATRLGDAVGSISDRLDQASQHMEERIVAFNALLEVVQEEAEATFVDTAARARGVRDGVEHLGQALRTRPPEDPPT
jgi:hypothetical protein